MHEAVDFMLEFFYFNFQCEADEKFNVDSIVKLLYQHKHYQVPSPLLPIALITNPKHFFVPLPLSHVIFLPLIVSSLLMNFYIIREVQVLVVFAATGGILRGFFAFYGKKTKKQMTRK